MGAAQHADWRAERVAGVLRYEYGGSPMRCLKVLALSLALGGSLTLAACGGHPFGEASKPPTEVMCFGPRPVSSVHPIGSSISLTVTIVRDTHPYTYAYSIPKSAFGGAPPVAQARPPAGRRRCPGATATAGHDAPVEPGAAGAAAGAVGPGGGGARVPRRRVDRRAGGRGDPTRLRRALPSRPRQSAAAPAGVEPAAASRAGDATRRGGHPAVVRTALAGAQKGAEAEGCTVVWVDESGFYLLPLAVRTWAPRGQTPLLQVKLTHDHLAAMIGITLDGRLFLQVRERTYDSAAVVSFLRELQPPLLGAE